MAMATETLKKIWLRVKNIQTYFFIHIREDFELEKKKNGPTRVHILENTEFYCFNYTCHVATFDV